MGRRRSRPSTTSRRSCCSARWASRSTPRPGCGTGSTSAAAAARSSTRGGRPRPAAIMISPLPGRHDAEAGLGHLPLPGIGGRGGGRSRQPGRARWRLPHAHAAVAGDAAGHLGRPRALPGDVLEPLPRPLLRRRRRQGRRRRLPVAARSCRRRDEHLGAPHLDHRGGVGARLPPERGRGRRRRSHRSHDGPGHHRLRHPAFGLRVRPEHAEVLRDHVAGEIGAIAKPGPSSSPPDLPKTRSGKIMRRLLRDVAEGRRSATRPPWPTSRSWRRSAPGPRRRPEEVGACDAQVCRAHASSAPVASPRCIGSWPRAPTVALGPGGRRMLALVAGPPWSAPCPPSGRT